MARAIWNGQVIAESSETVVVEGSCYFPPDSVNREFLKASDTTTDCPWKGTASYCTVDVNGEQNADAAWFYPDTKDAAKNIEGYYAFWKGVTIDT